MSESAPFRILVVCTGNLVRSALAHQLLQARLAELGSSIAVSSAGTAAIDGEFMPDQAQELSVRFGGNPEGHRARLLSTDLVAGADLILTATREHRARVVSLIPRASRLTFTLKQFARLINSVQERDVSLPEAHTTPASLKDHLITIATASAAQRGFLPPLDNPELDDIDDPYQRSQVEYDRAGVAVDAAVEAISAALLQATSQGRG